MLVSVQEASDWPANILEERLHQIISLIYSNTVKFTNILTNLERSE